jgi:glutamate 5-kinase
LVLSLRQPRSVTGGSLKFNYKTKSNKYGLRADFSYLLLRSFKMSKEIIVAKYGSETVTDLSRIAGYARDIAKMQERYGIIVVTSGAAALGEMVWKSRQLGDELPSKQVRATMGSARISAAWDSALWRCGHSSMQILATPHEINDPEERPELRSVLLEGLERGLVANVNGNDAMTGELVAEIEHLYDNDGTGAHIAMLTSAAAYVMHSSRGGFFDERGKEVRCLMPDKYAWALAIAAERDERAITQEQRIGTGGLTKKLEAGIRAAQNGINAAVVIAGTPLQASINGEAGTFIPAVA